MRTIAAALVCLCLGIPCKSSGEDPNATNSPAVTQLAPLPLRLPIPSWGANGIYQVPSGLDIEPGPQRPRPAFFAPAGVTNLALRKKVTSSATRPLRGKLSLVTDGQKEDGLEEDFDRNVVELPAGLQWVQIDLGAECNLSAVVVWHDFYFHQPVFRNVIVQAADDANFTRHVQTLFNNDRENLAGLGQGADRRYVETYEGRLIDAKGIKARYLRFYSNGNNNRPGNGYVEIEAWGLPAAEHPPSNVTTR